MTRRSLQDQGATQLFQVPFSLLLHAVEVRQISQGPLYLRRLINGGRLNTWRHTGEQGRGYSCTLCSV